MTILATLSHFECSERDAYAIGVFESSRSAFDGHYPGNPIVPGNFILATFLWMAQKTNPTNEVHTIRNLRLRKTILPDSPFTIEIKSIGDDIVECTSGSSEAVFSQARLVLAPRRTRCTNSNDADIALLSANDSSLCDSLLNSIPHRYPMLFVDKMFSEVSPAQTTFHFGKYSQDKNDKEIPLPIVVESVAQSAILLIKKKSLGTYLLAGVRKIVRSRPVLENSTVTYIFTQTRQIPGATIFDVVVEDEEAVCVTIEGLMVTHRI